MNNNRVALVSILSAALIAATPLAYGKTQIKMDGSSCSIESEYSVGRYGQAFLFKRTENSPRRIAIGGGKLYFDGQQATLNAADQQRIEKMESQMRELTPQAQAIAREAVDIAFIALNETSVALAPNDKDLVAALNKARVNAQKQVNNLTLLIDEKVGNAQKEKLVESVIEPVIMEYTPKITAAAVGTALSVAFGGEAKAKEFERRMQNMEKTLEAKVEARAQALEPKAQAFCKGMHELDDIENQLEFRTPDGKKLELFSVQAN